MPAGSPILHGAASFSLEPQCQCLAEQVGAEDCWLQFITHAGGRRVPGDALERNGVTSFWFFCLVYVQISSLIKSANALLKSLACKCFFLRLATQSCVFLSYITALSVLLSYWRAVSVGAGGEIMFKSLNQLNVFPYASFHHLGIKRPVLAAK